MMSEGAIWQPQWLENDFDPPDLSTADAADGRDEGRRIFEELRWREAGGCSASGARRPEIEVSRWTAAHGDERCEVSITPRHCHIISLSLAVSRVRWASASETLFEGLMPSGTMHISAPGQKVTAQFTPPFDFLHFHVDNRFLCEEGIIADETGVLDSSRLPLFRDALAEALGRSLLDPGDRGYPQYLASVCKAIVMRAMARQQDDRRCSALPKWRLRRVEQYLVANIGKPISLHDMAAAAGLSRMHFAAQFRAATGFRPHEYLLLKRVEHAKIALAETGMPLVEVAFSVGFNAQAHFSTVFKRFTGKSPARWKCEHRALNGATANRRLREAPHLANVKAGEAKAA